MMSKRAIFQSHHLNVEFHDFGTDTVVVSFNEIPESNAVDFFRLEGFLSQEKNSWIGINPARQNWFPRDDMVAAIHEINKVTNNLRAVTFGSSQGAYCALKYSSSLRAEVAVAFSPQYSIVPEVVGGFDDRFVEFHVPELKNGAPIDADDLCPENYLFVDPFHESDSGHAAEIRAAARPRSIVHVIRVPFSNHGTFDLIADGGLATGVLRSFIEGSPPQPECLRNMIRRNRSLSAAYSEAKVDYLIRRMGRGTRFLENCATLATPPKQRIIGLLMLLRQGALDRAEAMLTETDDATLALVPLPWLRRFFRHMNFDAGASRLPAEQSADPLQGVVAQLRAITTHMAGGQRDTAVTMLGRVMQSSNHITHFKRILYLARKLKHAETLERLLGDPAYQSLMDPRTTFDTRIELAEIYSANKDDERMRRALGLVNVAYSADQAVRRRLLDVIAMMDRPAECLDFARRTFGFSGIDLEYLRLRRICLLQAYAPKRARTQLKEIVKSFSPDSLLWEIASQLFSSQYNFHDAIRAQRKAVKYAPRPVPFGLRISLAKLYIREGCRIRARLQIFRIYWSSAGRPGNLRPSRDLAVRSGFYGLASLFARALCKVNPDDLDAFIMLSWIFYRTHRRTKSSRLATLAIKAIDAGNEPPRAAWPILVGALSALGRGDDARRMLDKGLSSVPTSKALLKIRKTVASAKHLASRVTAR